MRTEVLTADGNGAFGRLGGGKTSSGGRAKAKTGIPEAQEGGGKSSSVREGFEMGKTGTVCNLVSGTASFPPAIHPAVGQGPG